MFSLSPEVLVEVQEGQWVGKVVVVPVVCVQGHFLLLLVLLPLQ
jgi:hypothetical protein